MKTPDVGKRWDAAIKRIMKYFEFKECANVFSTMGYTYVDKRGNLYVPTERQLTKIAREMMYRAVKNMKKNKAEDWIIASGRLRVEVFKKNGISLFFTPESWEEEVC